MTRFRFVLLASLLFFVGTNSFGAGTLNIKIDSLVKPSFGSFVDSVSITNNDSIIVYFHLYNRSTLTVSDSNTTFGASYHGFKLPAVNYDSVINFTSLKPGDSSGFALKILNTNNAPIPFLLPGGSSVVIWPICAVATTDSAEFVLNYNLTGINNTAKLLSSVKYNQQTIYINFPSAEQRTVELYDATGRRVYGQESNAACDEISWGDLPSAVYILRVRCGPENASVKLLHY